MAEALVITYTKLLKKHGGPTAKQVAAFKTKHQDDAVFQRRARQLDKVYGDLKKKPARSARPVAR